MAMIFPFGGRHKAKLSPRTIVENKGETLFLGGGRYHFVGQATLASTHADELGQRWGGQPQSPSRSTVGAGWRFEASEMVNN